MDRFLQHAFDAEEIMAYLDGELESRRASALASHLESCGECQRVAKDFRQLSSHLLNFEVEHAPESLNAAISSAAMTFDSKQSSSAAKPEGLRVRGVWTRIPKQYVWAAAAALAVILFVIVGKPNLLTAPDSAHKASERATSERRSNLSLPQPASPSISDISPYLPLHKRGQAAALSENPEDKAAQYVPPTSEESRSADDSQSQLAAPQVSGPMIEQTVSFHIVPVNYDDASAAIEKMATERGGYVGSLTATAQSGAARDVSVELRIPARQADSFIADLRTLGKVVEETRSSEEVTAEYVDLQARMKAARAAEQRLVELLGTRTGKLSDVLEVERELARVRSEIESMQGQSNVMLHQVNYATVKVQLSEEYHEKLQSHSTSTWTKIRNAAIDGFNNLEEAIVGVLVFFLDFGLSIAFWLALLLVPSWLIWRKLNRRPQQ